MITPRQTRLIRVAGLRALQRAIVSILPRGLEARASAVLVPTRGAAEQLRRTIENLALADAAPHALVLPDLITRDELYLRLHEFLHDTPRMLTGFERAVLLRLAAEDAVREGHAPPFRLRPGLLAAMLEFYDELRRRGRTIDSLDRHVREPLEASRDTDRGAARLLDQTGFLASTFAAFERRVVNSGGVDEHALRSLALGSAAASPYRQIVLTVADQAADARGLWPADFDLLSRIDGLERLDIVATERLLDAGWLQRLHDALPGLQEERVTAGDHAPRLIAPAGGAGQPETCFVLRDREEELASAVRWIKQRARSAAPGESPALDHTAIVFARPLPYLYLARQVFASARVPYQALDSLPLAAEPFAAALDLVFAAVLEDASRTAIVELLASPHWRFSDPDGPGGPPSRAQVAALDAVLRDARYLGGWDRLAQLAARAERAGAEGTRDAARWRRAAPALRAAAAIGPALAAFREGPSASAQLSGLLDFIDAYGVVPRPGDAGFERHVRARGAVLGAVSLLRDAHLRFDDRLIPIVELVATLRRWIEAQTFAPRTGDDGVLLLDARAAAFADVDTVWCVGLVESDWPERARESIFYPPGLLRDLGWPAQTDRLSAARAAFLDLVGMAGREVSVSYFTLEDDALVSPSPFVEDIAAAAPVVERVDLADETRVFEHEAISVLPVLPEVVSGSTAEWLEHRLARTPDQDPRYRGTVGSRPAETYAVSRVERYLQCPFKYFAAHVLHLEEEREDESGLTALERGQLLHGVFEQFFTAWREWGQLAITAENVADAIALFAEVAEERLQTLPEADRALERTYLLGSAASPGLAERAFAFEIEQGEPVIERLIEHELEGQFVFTGSNGSREVHVRGKADRIDLLGNGEIRVVDYKLGRAPKPSRALQLPIYAECARQQLRGRHGREWTVGRAGYLAFREKNAFVDLGRAGNLRAAVEDGQTRFVDAVDRIEAGEFPPAPDEQWTCNRCGFPLVCRKDYVGDE